MEKVRPWCGQPSDRGRLKNSATIYTARYSHEQVGVQPSTYGGCKRDTARMQLLLERRAAGAISVC